MNSVNVTSTLFWINSEGNFLKKAKLLILVNRMKIYIFVYVSMKKKYHFHQQYQQWLEIFSDPRQMIWFQRHLLTYIWILNEYLLQKGRFNHSNLNRREGLSDTSIAMSWESFYNGAWTTIYFWKFCIHRSKEASNTSSLFLLLGLFKQIK